LQNDKKYPEKDRYNTLQTYRFSWGNR